MKIQALQNTLIIAFLLVSLSSFSQENQNIRIAFYNVENLFYPENDSLKNDDEFTPEGIRFWSFYRYREKSNRMAKAILSIGDFEPPAFVGMAEVENRKVVEDLIATETLKKFDYEVLHFESPDFRGIDVAAIYRKDIFKLLYSHNIKVPLDGRATRDLLYSKLLILNTEDTLHTFVCHWPSRYGGQAQSEPGRITAAQTLRFAIDSIRNRNPNAYCVVLGDLNDEWKNVSVLNYLEAKPTVKEALAAKSNLVNLMALKDENTGSHRYNGMWSYLDQIIVSINLLDEQNLDLFNKEAQVRNLPFLLETDEKYPGTKPFRTFIGMKYHGGFSDHLPVYIDLVLSNGK